MLNSEDFAQQSRSGHNRPKLIALEEKCDSYAPAPATSTHEDKNGDGAACSALAPAPLASGGADDDDATSEALARDVAAKRGELEAWRAVVAREREARPALNLLTMKQLYTLAPCLDALEVHDALEVPDAHYDGAAAPPPPLGGGGGGGVKASSADDDVSPRRRQRRR